jgi:hypothetical protein
MRNDYSLNQFRTLISGRSQIWDSGIGNGRSLFFGFDLIFLSVGVMPEGSVLGGARGL